MNKEALKNKIAEILGVSESEKDLAFEMILKRLSEILNYDEAINIPGIGMFSLKKEPLLREERNEKMGMSSKRNLIFLPDENDAEASSKSMYLTFNLDSTNQDYLEFDENVFSISVDKPVVSVNGIKRGNAANDNSEKMLATLEEKVQKLVSNTEKIPNYNIWNEFALKESSSENGTENQTDISQDEDLKQLVTEKVESEIVHENEIEETEIELQDDNTDDKISDIKFDAELEDENNEEIETEVDSELHVSGEEIVEESNIEKSATSENDSIEDEKKSDDSEEINWDWGDELKEELEADVSPIAEDDSISEKADKEKLSELFESVDDEKEEEENLETDAVEAESEKSVEDADEESEDDDTEKVNDSTQTVMYSPEDFEAEQAERAENETGKKKFEISKTLWILIGAFVLIGIIGIYFLFFTGEEPSDIQKNVVPDTLIHKKLKPIENRAELGNKGKSSEQTVGEKGNKVSGENVAQAEEHKKSQTKEEKNTNVKPAADNQSSSLYRTFPDEKQIRNLIFYQNSVYSVQVSSRRSKTKAEQYVKRLRNVGYNAFIVKTYLSKLKSTWYRVRIGFFNSEKEAMDFRMKNKF